MILGRDGLVISNRTQTIPQDSGFPRSIYDQVFYARGLYIDLILWDATIVWLFFGIAAIKCHRFPLNVWRWNFNFRHQVYTTSTTLIAVEWLELSDRLFLVSNTIQHWSLKHFGRLSVETTEKAWTGKVHAAPHAESNKTSKTECAIPVWTGT